MNKENEIKLPEELVTPEGYVLRPRPRPATDVTIRIPLDTLAAIDRVAAQRGMSREALLRYYIGHELRVDLAEFQLQEPFKTSEQKLAECLPAEVTPVAA